MKMTDADSLLAQARAVLVRYQDDDDAQTVVNRIDARLAADQQKGGGEVGLPGSLITHRYVWRKALELAVFSADPAHAEKWNRELAAYDQTFDRLWQLIEAEMKWPDPQSSIPAPAQQDGKASGGEVDDAVVRTFIAAYAQAKADRIPKVYAAGQREERDVIVALRAVRSMLLTKERHPQHADQETQG